MARNPMQAHNPMQTCGAKNRDGSRCRSTKCMPNGRCRMHGGKGSGPHPVTGRRSKYVAVFGERFLEARNAVDVLDSRDELAIYDMLLAEKAELLDTGFSAAWIDECQGALTGLREALFLKPDAQRARVCFQRLEAVIQAGGARCDAWEQLADKARVRVDMAVKAQTAELRAGEKMTEAALVGLMMRFLDVLEDVVGTDTAKRVADRIDRCIFGSESPLAAGTSGEVRRAGGERAGVVH